MSEDTDDTEQLRDPSNDTWVNRHFVTLLTTVLFGLLAFVMLIQVGC